ncbi:11645_t:CDS:2, partial [Funneliformis geosporum]
MPIECCRNNAVSSVCCGRSLSPFHYESLLKDPKVLDELPAFDGLLQTPLAAEFKELKVKRVRKGDFV